MKILLATNNNDKVKEIKSKLINTGLDIVSPNEIGIYDFEVDETENTLEGNALLKAKAFYEKSGLPSISDDTGLFVEKLNGSPGVYSARYAGENASYEDNCNKLMNELSDSKNRNAVFRTVICFYEGGNAHKFIGECEGQIIKETKGTKGFGYDPIFIPTGYELTFADMDSNLKNIISHRAKAVDKLINYLKDLV